MQIFYTIFVRNRLLSVRNALVASFQLPITENRESRDGKGWGAVSTTVGVGRWLRGPRRNLLRWMKRLSCTSECPVDILRSKCSARVLGVPHSEHIELLRAEASVARQISGAVLTFTISETNARLLNAMATCRDGIPCRLSREPIKKSPFRKNLAIFFAYVRKM